MAIQINEPARHRELAVCVPSSTLLVTEAFSEATEPSDRHGGVLARVSVLVVEDDDDARELLQMTLELAGASVQAAASVAAARQLLAECLPDLILSDIGMPLEDGYSLAAYVRQHIPEHIPMLALTAFTSAEDRAKAASSGFDAHLSKPIDANVLLETIEHWVRSN